MRRMCNLHFVMFDHEACVAILLSKEHAGAVCKVHDAVTQLSGGLGVTLCRRIAGLQDSNCRVNAAKCSTQMTLQPPSRACTAAAQSLKSTKEYRK
jgi:hypothetical protein